MLKLIAAISLFINKTGKPGRRLALYIIIWTVCSLFYFLFTWEAYRTLGVLSPIIGDLILFFLLIFFLMLSPIVVLLIALFNALLPKFNAHRLLLAVMAAFWCFTIFYASTHFQTKANFLLYKKRFLTIVEQWKQKPKEEWLEMREKHPCGTSMEEHMEEHKDGDYCSTQNGVVIVRNNKNPYRVSPGPPLRIAFMVQSFSFKGYLGVVYDPSGMVLKANKIPFDPGNPDDWSTYFKNPESKALADIFDHSYVLTGCGEIEKEWFLCNFAL